MKPDAAAIQALPLFAGVSTEQCERIASWFEVREVSEGSCLTTEGASGYTFFVVLEGTADVRVDGKPVSVLGPGDYFGEVALLDGSGRRTADVEATSPMRLGVMFGTEFRRFEEEAPTVVARLHTAMAERIKLADVA